MVFSLPRERNSAGSSVLKPPRLFLQRRNNQLLYAPVGKRFAFRPSGDC